MTTCPYTGGQVSSSLTPNLSRRTAQFLADSDAQLPRAAAARGTTDLDQRTDVRGLLVERVDGNEINVWHDESWFNNLGHYLILGNLRIDPRFATLSCWKTGTASAGDAIIVLHRIWRLTKERDLEDRIFRGIDVADLRSAILINQRWECVHADWLTNHPQPRPDTTSAAATKAVPPKSGNDAHRRRVPSTANTGSPPGPKSADHHKPSSRGTAPMDWEKLVLWIIMIALVVLAVICRTDILELLATFKSSPG